MARTAEGSQLTREHHRAQGRVRAATLRDLLVLWQSVEPTDLARTIGRFTAAATVLVRERNRESSALAAAYFRGFRAAEGIPGSVTPRTAEVPHSARIAAAVRGSALSGIINARQAGFSPQAAARNGFVKASGKTTKLVLDGSRETLRLSGRSDRQAARWQRVTSGEPCWWCAMLASRGPVFLSEESGGFEAHDHCACEPEIVYDGSQMTDEARQYRELWDSVRDPRDSHRSRVNFRRAIEGRAE